MTKNRLHKRTCDLRQVMPVYAIEDRKLVFKDGRIAVGYRVEGVEMEQWTVAQYDQFNAGFTGAIKSLPIGTVIQKMDCYFDHRYEKYAPDSGYFQAKTDGYFMDRPMLYHTGYLFITFPKAGLSKSNPISNLFVQLGLGRAIVENPLEGITKRLEEAETQGEEFASGLSAAGGFAVKRMSGPELAKLYLQYFNLEFATQPEAYARPISNGKEYIAVGEKKVQVISLKGQGHSVFNAVKNAYQVAAPMAFPLTHILQFPHIFTQNLLVEDSSQCLGRLDTEKKINTSLNFLTTQDNKIKAFEIEEFTAQVRAGNQQLVSLNISVILFEADGNLLKRYLEKTVSAFRQLNGCECLVESFDNASIFFANAPGNASQNFRWLLMPVDGAVPYFHFTTNYGREQSGEILCDRFRNPVLVNLFNTRLNNQNAIIIGPSGSGKSYTMGNFMCQRYERGARQIIVDVGGTYKNVIESLVGLDSYFEYAIENPLSFNPFLLERKAGRYQLTGDKLNFLTALLSIIWKGPDMVVPLSPAERAIFVRIIPAYYLYLNAHQEERPSMKSFFFWFRQQDKADRKQEEYRQEMQFFNVAQFLVVLKPFVDGEYRKVLNASREMDISDFPLVCFDMARVKSDPSLYPIVSMLITELALDQVRKFPDDIKFLYMDEAWSMLSDSMGDWVESMFRTIRKNNGSMNIITQGIDEIIASSVGPAIIQNAQTRIILNHTDNHQVDKLARHLGFTSHETDKVNSIRTGKHYRELFIKQGDTAKIYCVEVCPHLDAVLSSKPVERNYLRELVANYQGRIHYAIDQYVEDKVMKKGAFRET